MRIRCVGLLAFVSLVATTVAHAQSYDGDARKIGMGGVGFSDNIATEMIESRRPYRTIAIPLGLIQLSQDLDRFDPDDREKFDPILAAEYAANPLHYTFDRKPQSGRGRFISGMIKGDLTRDLNDYRGFKLPTRYEADGLVAPNWGKTIKFLRRPGGAFQGFYVGVGPYLSIGTDFNVSRELSDLLAGSTDRSIPNRTFEMGDRSVGQVALAVTGGYRARFSLPGKRSTRDGIYLGMNYHYLRGFQYLDADINARLDTDDQGLLTAHPTAAPLRIDYLKSDSGNGYALDFGVGAVIDKWEFGFGANGVANRINWNDLRLRNYTLESVLNGGDFIERELPPPSRERRVELPVRYTTNLGYHHDRYSLVAEYGRGFQGDSYRAGAELRLYIIEFRGGVRYNRDRWHPTGGVGLNLGRRFSIDAAAFGVTTNLEKELKPSFALSIRLNSPVKD